MNFFNSKPGLPAPVYQYRAVCGVDYPPPVLERGWLHGRQAKLAWDLERIAAHLGDRCWLSFHDGESKRAKDPRDPCLAAVAGFWPGGGFVEVVPQNGNSLEDHPRHLLAAYAPTAEACTRLFEELLAGFVHADTKEPASCGTPRVGILNNAYGSLEVQRITLTAEQTVARDLVDTYYGDGASAWTDAWVSELCARRYGLSVLTGAPGTGKTTLLRSLASWLAATHLFYFMPAARFAQIESGEIVNFWADENRNSRLRKILILEDAESVLQRRAEDNREKVASLLNLTDGMMGDALGLQVVCTLNCGLDDLDQALLRPGRLLAQREFGPLPLDQARRLATHLGRPLPEASATLAEIANDAACPRPAPRPRTVLGFQSHLVT